MILLILYEYVAIVRLQETGNILAIGDEINFIFEKTLPNTGKFKSIIAFNNTFEHRFYLRLTFPL